MKIAISSNGSDINSNIYSKFGRCPFFIIVNSESMDYESVKNEINSFAEVTFLMLEKFEC